MKLQWTRFFLKFIKESEEEFTQKNMMMMNSKEKGRKWKLFLNGLKGKKVILFELKILDVFILWFHFYIINFFVMSIRTLIHIYLLDEKKNEEKT